MKIYAVARFDTGTGVLSIIGAAFKERDAQRLLSEQAPVGKWTWSEITPESHMLTIQVEGKSKEMWTISKIELNHASAHFGELGKLSADAQRGRMTLEERHQHFSNLGRKGGIAKNRKQ